MGYEWGYRIKALREERQLTQSELAKRAGLSRSYISRIEGGAFRGLRHEVLQRLARALRLTPDSLSEIISGRKQTVRQETAEDILDRLRVAISSTVPVYDEFPLHAGSPVEPVDHVPIVRDRARGRNLEGYIAYGKCLEPEISDGNIIIIDRDGQMDNGDIVAALVDGELYLARLRKIADEVYLENNDGRIKLEECQLAAPVIEVRRRLK